MFRVLSLVTPRTVERLTDNPRDIGVNVRHLHSEIDATGKAEVLSAFDVLVGINLLRASLVQ